MTTEVQAPTRVPAQVVTLKILERFLRAELGVKGTIFGFDKDQGYTTVIAGQGKTVKVLMDEASRQAAEFLEDTDGRALAICPMMEGAFYIGTDAGVLVVTSTLEGFEVQGTTTPAVIQSLGLSVETARVANVA